MFGLEFLLRPAARMIAPEAVAGIEATASRLWGTIASKFGSKAAQAGAKEAGAAVHGVEGATAHAAEELAAKEAAAKALAAKQRNNLIGHGVVAAAVTTEVMDDPVARNRTGGQHAAEAAVGGLTGFGGGMFAGIKTLIHAPGAAKILFLPAAILGGALGYKAGKGSMIGLEKLSDATDTALPHPPAAQAAGSPTGSKTDVAAAPAAGGAVPPTTTASADAGFVAQQTERLAAEARYAAAVKDVIADIDRSGAVSKEHSDLLARRVEEVTRAEANVLGKSANDQGVQALVAAMGPQLVATARAEASATPAGGAVAPIASPGMREASSGKQQAPSA